jgi:hypothetical protein
VAVPAIACASVLIQCTGAAVDPGGARVVMATSQLVGAPSRDAWIAMTRPSVEAEFDRYLFDWRYTPIGDEANELVHGQHLMSQHLQPAPQKRAIALLGTLVAFGLGLAWMASREAWPERKVLS